MTARAKYLLLSLLSFLYFIVKIFKSLAISGILSSIVVLLSSVHGKDIQILKVRQVQLF